MRLTRTPRENFAKWDQLLAQRPVAGICGIDAHAKLIGRPLERRQVSQLPVRVQPGATARAVARSARP